MDLAKRRFFTVAGAVGTTMLLPRSIWAAPRGGTRELALRSIHTNEKVEVVYWEKGEYLPDALRAINYQLRDHRTGDVHSIDVRLLDWLHDLQRSLRREDVYDVISGYRSPNTNRMLATRSKRVAKRSLHMRGMAVDVRPQHGSLRKLRRIALDARRGGVGYYPRDGFVHLDLGSVRRW